MAELMPLPRSLKVWLVLAALASALVALGIIALRAYREERRCFIPVQHPPRLALAAWAISGLREVSFKSREGNVLRGFFAPPSHGAAVVLTHGSNGERSDLIAEARLLAAAGFGVLAFDWPGHGQSDGSIGWGRPERQALSGALDWLSEQPEVSPDRLGAFGFSMGGYIVTQLAAQDTRLRAIAIAGSPHDPVEHLYWEYRHFGALTQWPALLALRVSGMRTDEFIPEQVIGQIAPRPVLIVGGKDDQAVPEWIARRLFLAASEPKTLELVAGAGHGGYAAAQPEAYPRALLRLFSTLEPPPASTPSPEGK